MFPARKKVRTLRTFCEVKYARHKRTNVVGFRLHEVPRVAKFRETESKRGLAKGLGEGGELLYNGTELQLCEMRKFWRWRVVLVAQRCRSLNAAAMCTEKWLKVVNVMLWGFYHSGKK